MNNSAPIHGGNLELYAKRYGIARERWLDLSTGINPCAYPLPSIPTAILHGLPYPDPAFEQAAAGYYGYEYFLAVPGSQWAIEQLPGCFPPGSVALPDVGYREHLHQWQRCGHEARLYDASNLQASLPGLLSDDLRAVVVINPNNPSTDCFDVDTLYEIAAWLKTRDIVLVVDEAFIDAQPACSLLVGKLPDNVIVLRSFGKFFGLPGVRLGFVMGQCAIVDALRERLGLWSVNAVAQYAARVAFADRAWQQSMQRQLANWCVEYHCRLAELLGVESIVSSGCTALFASFLMERTTAQRWFEACARCGILVRLWEVNSCYAYLRFGLVRPDDHEAYGRLAKVLVEVRRP
ncbi:threonine-phosphate decarboxylase [Phytohalomonas tamaricis]|uniref:threonine-phosphate decarboxylase n=1 Tax=Phytohalomonas tamaricis TaxID=2081032 RepID=UPI000D0BA3BA|nr:threonine-phosphate decarboxylase [Phytohalomonas tamaricis]